MSSYDTYNDSRSEKTVISMVISAVVLIGVVVFLLVNSLYIVREWEQVVITQFGEIRGEPVTDAGLHFKMPFVQEVHRFEKRLLRWDGQAFQPITRDRRTVNVNITARWRIEDAATFYRRLRSVDDANRELLRILDAAVRNEMGKYDLFEVVRSSNQIIRSMHETPVSIEAEDPELEIEMEELATLGREIRELRTDARGNYVAGRPVVLAGILDDARERLADLDVGIELVDVMMKQLNYTQDIESNVYQQMNAELAKISAGFRSHGRKNAEQKLGEMERELATIESEAIHRSRSIRGRAEAEAIAIYADAFNRDIEFYNFLRTLEAYEEIVATNSSLVLRTDSPLFNLLKNPHQALSPNAVPPAAPDGEPEADPAVAGR